MHRGHAVKPHQHCLRVAGPDARHVPAQAQGLAVPDRVADAGVPGVAEPADRGRALPALIAAGRALCDTGGAAWPIMGSAGTAPLGDTPEVATGLSSIEACLGATAMAPGHIAPDLTHREKERTC